MPFLAAAPYVLQGLSALGGIFGRKKKKYMDPETLRRLYGPGAIGRDTTDLANSIINSPYGQQLLASAAEQGQTLQTEMGARAAESGLSPDTGGQSGAGDFAVSAAAGAQSGLERQTKAGIYQSAMPLAAQFNQSLMQAGLEQQGQQNAEPSTWQRIAGAAGQAAAAIPAGGPSTPSGALGEAASGPVMRPSEMPGLRNVRPAQMSMPAISGQAPGAASYLNPGGRPSTMRRSLTRRV